MMRSRKTGVAKGFALPTVLIASLVMFIVMLAGVQVTVSVNVALRAQDFNKMAELAAEAGLAAAKSCIEENDGDVTWSDTKPLTPATNCSGDTAAAPTLEVLVVAGGGGGGGNCASCGGAGGGGGGGVVHNPAYQVTTTGDIPVTVGAGGAGGAGINNATGMGQNGSDSAFGTITAIGGGGGAPQSGAAGQAGGSGGGGSGGSSPAPGAGGAGTAGQGYAGGAGVTSPYGGGGGGGAGGTGGSGSTKAGGIGRAFQLGGFTSYYGGGGGGGGYDRESPGVGGSGGGGNGANRSTNNGNGYPGIPNTGGGGGGSAGRSSSGAGGGAGGSGIVIVKYPTGTLTATGGSVTTIGGDTVHTFTSNGSFSITQIGATCEVDDPCAALSSDANSRSTFRVGAPAIDGGSITIQSTGYVHLLRTSTGAIWRSYEQTGKAVWKDDTTITKIPWEMVSAGTDHTCGISGGKAYCWGGNSYGQLGNNSTTSSNIPVPVDTSGVLSGKTVTDIAAGEYFTCAVANGQAFCWGQNSTYGQLGNNTTASSSVPVAVTNTGVLSGKTVTKITASYRVACAIANGQAFCWGYNTYGQLGNNSTTYSRVPVATDTSGVLSGKTVTDLSAGYRHTCAVANGQAFCWGYNAYGQLGNNSTAQSLIPVAVDTSGVMAGKTVTAIGTSGAYYHSCALASGQVYCWGNNSYGNLGNDSLSSSQVPVAVNTSGVLSGKTVVSLAVGSRHTCAVAGGTMHCWGLDTNGQLGNSTVSSTSDIPLTVDGPLTSVSSITGGEYHTCAISEGTPYCWGNNTYGQLGDGTTDNRGTPTSVSTTNVTASARITDISAGYQHSCAITYGRPYCWGYNANGQLGIGITNAQSMPAATDTTGVLFGKTATKVTTNASEPRSCAVASGGAYCWGSQNTYGQLGNDSTAQSLVPVAVTTSGVLSGKTVTKISSSRNHSCAIADGQVFCWGYNNYGELGNGTNSYSRVPVAVDTSGVLSGKTVTDVSVGDYHSCVVASGQPYCWGRNNYGQSGDNTTNASNIPVATVTSGVLAGKTVTDIAAGQYHTCAVANGQVFCWGMNSNYQFGAGNQLNSPVPVATTVNATGLQNRTVTAITAGANHTCAVANGIAFCWGYGGFGKLGTGSTSSSSTPAPVTATGVLAGKTVTHISAGLNHSCAIANGEAFCWGRNTSGEVGDGTSSQRTAPVAVNAAQYGPITVNIPGLFLIF